jgi:hypothetical protein
VNGPCNQNGRLTTASRMKLVLPLRNGVAEGKREIVIENIRPLDGQRLAHVEPKKSGTNLVKRFRTVGA